MSIQFGLRIPVPGGRRRRRTVKVRVPTLVSSPDASSPSTSSTITWKAAASSSWRSGRRNPPSSPVGYSHAASSASALLAWAISLVWRLTATSAAPAHCVINTESPHSHMLIRRALAVASMRSWSFVLDRRPLGTTFAGAASSRAAHSWLAPARRTFCFATWSSLYLSSNLFFGLAFSPPVLAIDRRAVPPPTAVEAPASAYPAKLCALRTGESGSTGAGAAFWNSCGNHPRRFKIVGFVS
mmetsp:Transcript_22225/g.51290  ORF Transcript_22225/g.51290 Transcript_22225/m.51290 type:complete len:241 (-) Transcript_22225:77-799(-)